MSEQVSGAQAELAAMVGDRSDEELNGVIKEQGSDVIFKPIFEGMQQAFLPDKAAGKTVVIQYDLNLPDGTESWQLDVKDGTCTVSKGADKEAGVTLTLAGPDFLRLISGKLNGVQAFMSGKLRIKGDMMVAQTMQTWFAQT